MHCENGSCCEFDRIHPLVLLTYFFALLCICMFVMNPVFLAEAFFGGVLFRLLQNGSCADRKLKWRYLCVVFAVTALSNPIFSHNGKTALFFVNGNAVTAEAFAYGCVMGLMIVTVLLWCSCMSRIMTSEKIFGIFGTVFPGFALMFSMSMRFVPLFIKNAGENAAAIKCLGLKENKGFLGKCRFYLDVFYVQLGIALENSIDTAASMRARGYGISKRTCFTVFGFRLCDICVLLITVAVSIYIFAAGKHTAFYFYPGIYAVFDFKGAVSYVLFALLCFLPSALEIHEEIRWKYSISKI